jgi:hypothetical protein
MRVIDRRKQKFVEWKAKLDSREAKVCEVEPFLPLARKLQEMKLVLEDVQPLITEIDEVTQMQNTDNKQAILYLIQQLRLNRAFGDVQRQIEIAQGQLKMLNTICAQKERGLSTLTELQNKGISLDAIYGLSKILDLERMGKEWNPLADNGQKVGQNYSMNMGQNLGQNSGQNQPRTSPEYWYQQSRSSR